MTESAGLERGYRRLLAWYPRPFRREQAEEVLAVLMAGAQPGQRRPRLMESADLIRSALRMRFRPARPALEHRAWTDGLALFSLVAPLFLLVVNILEVALPYRLPSASRSFLPAQVLGRPPQIGGLSLFHLSGLGVAIGGQAIVAALVLLGLRRAALAAMVASAVYWIVVRYWIPSPLQLLSISVYLLGAAALIASPGPRRGRQLMTWGQGLVLLVAAAAVQVSTLRYDATSSIVRFLTARPPDTSVYLVLSVILAVVAAGLAVAVKMNRYFLLLLAAMFYPYALQLASSPGSTSSDLIGHPTPVHLALLFLPLLLLACWAVLTAVTPLRHRIQTSPDPGSQD